MFRLTKLGITEFIQYSIRGLNINEVDENGRWGASIEWSLARFLCRCPSSIGRLSIITVSDIVIASTSEA